METLTKMIDTASVKPYRKNAKKHPDAQIDMIADSISEFGFKQPVVVDKDNVCIIGHGRLLAAKKLGIEQIPAIIADDLDPEQVKALRLADNKLNESDWDDLMLDEALKEIAEIDMSRFGFDDLDLDSLDDDEPPQIAEDSTARQDAPRICQPGDRWTLGRHVLMCGDSTSAADVDRLCAGIEADCLFTDPPYGLKKERENIANDNLNRGELLDFNEKWLEIAFQHIKDKAGCYVWGFDEILFDLYAFFLRPKILNNEITFRNYITWAKHSAIGIGWDKMTQFPKESEKALFFNKCRNWNNNNAEFFDPRNQDALEYLQGQAKASGMKAKDVQRICGCGMHSHWFSKSQFALIPKNHYRELQDEFPGFFTKPWEELKELTNRGKDRSAYPYFDLTQIDDEDTIGLTDVWRINQMQGNTPERMDAGFHATPKPIMLCARGIHASTPEDGVVLDLFGGSGSTLITCEQLGRCCLTMELLPEACDSIIARYIRHTNDIEGIAVDRDGEVLTYEEVMEEYGKGEEGEEA